MTTATDTRVGQSGRPDEVCAAAVDIAKAAVLDDGVGAHLDVVAEGDRIVTHYFECLLGGYRGWRWAVTVARAPRTKLVTVCETVLLPGPDAVVTPDWIPWHDRVAPGDLGVGDLMPTAPDDERLVPGYLLSDDPAVEDVVWEIGLGRVRVLSREGRIDAADRWWSGDAGPAAPISVAAPANARCVTCGFYLPLAGAMRQSFGVCANMYAPDDGRAVAADHGCGAHSEVLVEPTVEVDEAPTIYDDGEVDPVDVTPDAVAAAEEARKIIEEPLPESEAAEVPPMPVRPEAVSVPEAVVTSDADTPETVAASDAEVPEAAAASDADTPDADAPEAVATPDDDAETPEDEASPGDVESSSQY